MAITSSKINTFEDLSLYNEGDFIACYLPNAPIARTGWLNTVNPKPYYVGVIDSVDIVNEIGKPNVLTCKEVMSVFDQEIIVTQMSGSGANLSTSWQHHCRELIKKNFMNYDYFTDNYKSGDLSLQVARPWDFAQQTAGISIHRKNYNNSGAWKYEPKEPFSVTSFLQYFINGTKKYNVFARIDGVQWDLPQNLIDANGEQRDVYPSELETVLDQFNLIDIDFIKTDDSDAASFKIKDNNDDLFDWEFSTTVGTSEANMVRVFDPSFGFPATPTTAVNETSTTRVVNGEKVVTVKAKTNSQTRQYPEEPQYYKNTDGLYYLLTTRGEIIGNGTQATEANGSSPTWETSADPWAGDILFDVPDDSPKFLNGVFQTKSYHRFDKYVQMPVKVKQILLNASDKPASEETGTMDWRQWYLSAARDALSAALYAHQFKIKVRMDSQLVDYNELYIGRSVYVTYKGVVYKSLVTGRTLKSGTNYVTIILGHNRHKLGALLQEKLT